MERILRAIGSKAVGKQRRPLHTYLLCLGAVVAAVGIVSAIYLRATTIKKAEEAVGKAARFTAELAAEQVRLDLEELSSAVAGLARTPNLRDVLQNPTNCSLSFTGQGVFPRGRLDIVGPDGGVKCSSDPAAVDRGLSYASADWLDAARGRPVLAGPVEPPVATSSGPLGPQSPRPRASFEPQASSHPVVVATAPAGSGILIVGVLELPEVGPALQDQFGGWRRFEFLVTDGDRIVTSSLEPDRWSGNKLPGSWRDTSGTFERADLEGTDRYYGSARVPRTSWAIYAGAERDATLASAEDLYRMIALMISLGVGLSFAALWFVWRLIARPIRTLRRAVGDAASGPATASWPERGPDEVVSLAEAIQSLQRSYEERSRALQESEARYRDMFERAVEGIAITCPRGRIREANPAIAQILGYDSPEAFLESVPDARAMYSNPSDRDRMLEAIRERRAVRMDVSLRRSDGRSVLASIHYIPILDEAGDVDTIQTRVIDETERRHLEKQLAQSQRLESLGQLAGGIAHDFNNLLAVIVNYSSFVADALEDAAPTDGLNAARGDVEQISTAARRASSLTQRLLTFARQDVVRPEVLDPNAIVGEVDKLLARTIGEDIGFTTVQAPDAWSVNIDPGQLQQVILNLAVNARDAMPDGGTLTIETANIEVDEGYAATWADLDAGRYVRIRVSDTGTGMVPEVAEKIFDPFFTTKPTGQGTGLGLATVHGIVTQARGSIHVYSEPDVGTSISVLLPATDAPPTSERRHQPGELSGTETILVVEDEAAIREVMRRILVRCGYEVILAEAGEKALEIAADHSVHIDLVITDVVMPGMLGREVTERISELRPETRLVYMSGYAQAVLDSRGRLEPGRVLVEKPFSEAELLTVVREALDGGAS